MALFSSMWSLSLDVARPLGRKGGRKPKMTDSKIESAKKLLPAVCHPRT